MSPAHLTVELSERRLTYGGRCKSAVGWLDDAEGLRSTVLSTASEQRSRRHAARRSEHTHADLNQAAQVCHLLDLLLNLCQHRLLLVE